MIPALLLSLLAAADPCTQAPPLPPDPVAAQAYREVGDLHRANGELSLAMVAYRDALRRAPDDAALKEALEALCHPGPTPFEKAQALLARGDRKGALPLLEEARRGEDGEAAALLEGIALYELGEEAQARPLFEAAAQAPALEKSARLFLGLIALHQGERHAALDDFDAAGADPSLAEAAQRLRALTRADGKLQLSLLAESVADSNPALLPTAAVKAGSPDLGGEAVGLLLARPLGASGPYARLSGTASLQAEHSEFNLAGGAGALGWRQGRGDAFARGEYAFAGDALAGEPFVWTHTLLAQGQLAFSGWLVGGSYQAQRRDFQTAASRPYTGWLQQANGYLGKRLGSRVLALLGYRLGRDQVAEPSLSYVEHAPFAELRLFLGERLRLRLGGDWALRLYDAGDADLGLHRTDHALWGRVSAELDLTDALTARLTVAGTHQLSTAADFRYDAATASLGLQYTAGFF